MIKVNGKVYCSLCYGWIKVICGAVVGGRHKYCSDECAFIANKRRVNKKRLGL